jgi:hypothetical protein
MYIIADNIKNIIAFAKMFAAFRIKANFPKTGLQEFRIIFL